LPDALSYAIRSGIVNPNKVGNALRFKEGTRFGDDGLYLHRAGEYQRAVLWVVGSSTTSESGEFGEFGEFRDVLPCKPIRAHTCAHAHAHTCENDSGVKQTHETHQTHETPMVSSSSPGYEDF